MGAEPTWGPSAIPAKVTVTQGFPLRDPVLSISLGLARNLGAPAHLSVDTVSVDEVRRHWHAPRFESLRS